MKKLIIVAVLFTALTTHAQTSSNFVGTVLDYLSSNNTNFTFIGNKIELETGAEYQNGMNWANDIRLQYNLTDKWSVNGQIDNAGVAGTVEEYQGGLSYAIINSYAIKAQFGINGGYNHLYESGDVMPFIEFMKKMTPNTYSFVELDEPVYFRAIGSHPGSNIPNAWSPQIRLGVGCTF